MPMRTERISELRQLIWYGHPPWPRITTMGPCPRCQNGVGRGSGLCPGCLVKELGAYVGTRKAQRFLKLVRDIRKVEQEMDEPEEAE